MTCAEYRELVAADVDGALGSDVEAAVQHRASCSSCMRLFEQQVSIRDLLRLRPLEPPAPVGLRTRIVAHLEEESRRRAAPWWRLWVRWAGAALIVACAAAVWIVSTRDGWFTPLIESYDLASRGALRIAFPTSAPAALEAYYRQYHQEGFPEHVVDLSPKGFRLIGGVLRDFPKRKARLAVYSDGESLIVCDYQFATSFPFTLPSSGEPIFFSRLGVNFCARRMGDKEVCVLAARIPMDRFRNVVGSPEAG